MSNVLKKSTGLTGLKVDPNAIRNLGIIYERLARALKALPEEYPYRKETEELLRKRVRIINSNHDIVKIEKEINNGQIEEVIEQAKKELFLARNLLTWKPWEPLIAKEPEHQWSWPPHK